MSAQSGPQQNQNQQPVLGLMTDAEIEIVVNAVKGAEVARDNLFQEGHPLTYGGTIAYAERTRLLRVLLADGRWKPFREKNLEGVQTLDERVILLTCAADARTGRPGSAPSTRPKGDLTERQVRWNRLRFGQRQASLEPTQLELLEDFPVTLILLVHRRKKAVRAEISIPVGMEPNGTFEFHHREFLPLIEVATGQYLGADDDGPETIDFDIE